MSYRVYWQNCQGRWVPVLLYVLYSVHNQRRHVLAGTRCFRGDIAHFETLHRAIGPYPITSLGQFCN